MTDGCCGDAFVVDGSLVTSERNGADDTSSCLPQRLAEGACAPNGVRGGTTRSSLVPEVSGDVARNDVMW